MTATTATPVKTTTSAGTTPSSGTATRRTASNRAATARAAALWGAVAAAATSASAAIAHAAGVSLEIDGEMIPILGFAQLTVFGAVIGGVLLAVLNRCSNRARALFVRAAVVLTAVSCIPSVAWPDDAATKAFLVATHVLAAAVIVPALARQARS